MSRAPAIPHAWRGEGTFSAAHYDIESDMMLVVFRVSDGRETVVVELDTGEWLRMREVIAAGASL